MKALPLSVDITASSLKDLRNWTSGANSEPQAAVAMMHAALIGWFTVSLFRALL